MADDSDTDIDDSQNECKLNAYFLDEWINVKLKPVILWDCENNTNLMHLEYRSHGKFPRYSSQENNYSIINKWQKNKMITIDFILANRHEKWDWGEVSSRDDLRMKHIIDNPDVSWNYSAISNLPDLTMDYVIANIHKNWHNENISKNKNFTMFDIQKYKIASGHKLIYMYVCENPNLTTDFVLENKFDTLDWRAIRKHRFTTERNEYVCAKRGHLCLHTILNDYDTQPRAYGELPATNGLQIAINVYLVKMIAKYI